MSDTIEGAPVVDLAKTYLGRKQIHAFSGLVVDGVEMTPDTTTVFMKEMNEDDKITAAYGTTVPTDGEAGYAGECEFYDSDAPTGSRRLYRNIGSDTSCEFVLEGTVTLTEEGKKAEVSADDFTVTHNAAAASGNYKLYAKIDLRNLSPVLPLAGDFSGAPNFWEDDAGDSIMIPGEQFEQKTITVKDDDSAATNGVQVYLHIVEGNIGIFKAVNAGDADARFEDADGNQWLVHDDDNAATGGYPVYFDEDASSGGRFQADLPAGSIYVKNGKGERFIKINADSSASSNGVAVYFDDDEATVTERLRFVSPTNADGSELTPDPTTGQNTESIGFIYIELFYDEDAAVGGKLQHNNAEAPTDFYIQTMAGSNKFIKVTYNSDAATDGVNLYLDTGNSNTTKIEFVSPTTSNGVVETSELLRPFEVIK